jgi:hypothetical protein
MMDVFSRFGGRQPFRCRSCRRRFFASPSAVRSQKSAVARAQSHRSKRRLSGRTKKRIVRTLIMVVIFAVAFILFLTFLRYMMTERQTQPYPGIISE